MVLSLKCSFICLKLNHVNPDYKPHSLPCIYRTSISCATALKLVNIYLRYLALMGSLDFFVALLSTAASTFSNTLVLTGTGIALDFLVVDDDGIPVFLRSAEIFFAAAPSYS